MKIEKIRRKMVKPHTPTPQILKNYNISFIDKFMGPLNFAILLFYKSKPENNIQLEESLAKILVEFYPLAGRFIKTDQTVDCSDQGVEFVEAEAQDVELLDLVSNIETEQLSSLLTDQYFKLDETVDDPIMSIQATRFVSGGMVIAISVSHRIIDASSLGTFISAWSKLGSFTPLSFDLPKLVPNKDFGFRTERSSDLRALPNIKIFFKRLLFNNEVLLSLRSKIGLNNTISRVRVMCAVISKALIDLDRMKLGVSRDFVIFQAINMRERTILPQPKHSFGNFAITSLTRRMTSLEIGLKELIDVIGESVEKNIAEFAEIVSPNPNLDGRDIIVNNSLKIGKIMRGVEMNSIIFSDWSKFGFYEADFGWRKPIWVGIGPNRHLGRTTVLMSNKEGDGIEAWVYLNEDDMHYFEQQQEIMQYAIN